MANEITNAVVNEVVSEVAKEAVAGAATTKLPTSKVSLNMGAVAAGAGIALGLVGLGIAGWKIYTVIKKKNEAKKADKAENPEK